MVVKHTVAGFEDFLILIGELEPLSNLSTYFSLEVKPTKVKVGVHNVLMVAEPVVKKALEKAPKNSHFVYVDVGERAYWKDLNCPFRKHPDTHLVCIPTLLRWKGSARLDGDDVAKYDLVEMLFEEEN